MAMNVRRSKNPLSALLDYASQRGDEASSIGSVMTQLASPILKGQGVQVDNAVQRGPVPQPTLVDFNTTSKERLAGADPRLSGFLTEVERRASGQGINMQIAEAKRTADRQAELVAAGISPTMNSNHLSGNAADIYLVGPDGKPNYNIADYQPVADIAKAVAAEQGLTDFQWGGDWKSKDAVHFQLGGTPNLNTTVSTMSAPNAGGALPQTVEGILSSLYPDSTEAEKTAHRKDIWRGLSQGLSALSQGRQVDLSNIAANADQRRRQNVVDMRERERARAGAALIYSQTGDADMAGAVAGGLMSLNDVFSERERKRLAEQADAQRLKTEQANDALGGLVLGMTGEFGFSEKRTAEIAAALDAGADPSTVLTLTEQAKVADEARKKEEAAATAREKRDALAEEYANSEDPLLRLTGQLMLGNPDISFTDAYKVASDRFPVSTEGASGYTLNQGDIRFGPDNEVVASVPAAPPAAPAPTNEMQNADALVASGAINPDTDQPFTPAEATAVMTLPAPAGSEQSNAQNEAQDLFASKATNPDTKQPFTSYGEALAWRLGSGGPKTSIEVNTGPQGNLSDVALRAVEAEQMIPKGKAFKQTFNPDTKMWEIYRDPTTGQPQTVNIVNPDEAMMDAEKAADRAKIASVTANTVISSGKEVLETTANWKTGALAAVENYAAGFNPQSDFSDVSGKLAAVRDLVALDTIQDMQQASPTGSTGIGPATERDASRLERRFGELDPTRKPETFRADLMAALNDYSDTIHGTPAEILDMYKKGEISAEIADAMSTRYVVRGAGVDPDAETLGTLTNLGLSNSRDTVLGKLTDKDIAPRVIAKLGPDYDKIINDEGFYDEGGAFDELTPTEQTEIERLLGVMEND